MADTGDDAAGAAALTGVPPAPAPRRSSRRHAIPVRFATEPSTDEAHAEENVLVALFDQAVGLALPRPTPIPGPEAHRGSRPAGPSVYTPTALCRPPPAVLLAQAGVEGIDSTLRLGESQSALVHQVLVSRSERRRRQEVTIALAGRRFDEPMRLELLAWNVRGVYEEVAFSGQHVITTRWVLTEKPGELPTDPAKRKARLCVRGFQDPAKNSVVSTSPTAGRASVRVLLALFAASGYDPRSVDVRTAFLQGMPIDRVRPVYVQPPPQARVPAGMVWKLRKCAYGLTDAPRWWYQTVRALMGSLGYERAESDHGLFLHSANGRFSFGLAAHVDDFLYGGLEAEVTRFEQALTAAFDVGPVAIGDLTFTGLRVRTSEGPSAGTLIIAVDQDHYLDTIEEVPVPAGSHAAAAVTTAELTLFRRVVGALLWASGQTQPYMSCTSSLLARRFHQATVHDLGAANRVVRAARAAVNFPVTFQALTAPRRLVLFSEASSITLDSATAQTGYLVFMAHDNGTRGDLSADTPLVLLAWGSHKQRRVTHSSFAAETYALLDGMSAAVEVACILGHMTHGPDGDLPPIDAVTDCLSLFNTLSATGLVRPKEFNAGVAALRELYTSGGMSSVTWTPAGGQLADCLTKASSSMSLRAVLSVA